ncbi:MAG: HD domain-containing phosphohydrolase, partial [Nitrospiria bacterium]
AHMKKGPQSPTHLGDEPKILMNATKPMHIIRFFKDKRWPRKILGRTAHLPPTIRQSFKRVPRFILFGLKSKLIIVFTLLFVVVIVSLFLFSIEQEKRVLTREIEKRGRLTAANLAMSARDAVLDRDLLTLNSLIGAVQQDKDVIRTFIVDHRDIVLMHSDVTKISTPFSPSALPARDASNSYPKESKPEGTSPLTEFSEPIRYGDKIIGRAHLSLSLAGVEALVRQTRVQLFAMTGISLVLGMAGILFLTNVFLRPVATLAKATQEVANGNLDIWTPVKNRDEVGQLESSFSTLVTRLKSAYDQVERGHFEMTLALAAAVEAKDPYTRGHCGRVCGYAMELGKSLGLRRNELKELELTAILHDIGKIGIKDDILTKPGRLTADELRMVHLHPRIGHQIMEKVEPLHKIAKYTLHHHESFQGKGYPEGLKGEGIPLISRIITVADSYDSMSSNRPYRRGLPEDVVIERLIKGKGDQFDPSIVDIFLKLYEAGIIEKIKSQRTNSG